MTYPQPNQHGVFQRMDCEIISLQGSDIVQASIFLVESAKDKWHYSYTINLHHSGVGYMPHVKDQHTCATRELALIAAREEIRKFCVREASQENDHDSPTWKGAKEIFDWLSTLMQMRMW